MIQSDGIVRTRRLAVVQPAASMLSQRAIRQDCLHLAQQPNWLSLSISSFFQQLQLERRRRCRRCQWVQYCACLLRHTCLVVLPTLNSGLAQYMSNASLHAIHAGWHVRVRLVTYRLCHRSKMQLCLCALRGSTVRDAEPTASRCPNSASSSDRLSTVCFDCTHMLTADPMY